MALELYDRVKETSTTTGTGTLTLAGAVTGFRTFGSVLADADTTYYAIELSGTGEWEVGLGTIGGSGTTLARTTPLASSNAGAAVNFSAGTKTVFGTLPATLFSTAAATFLVTPSSANLRGLLTDESGAGAAYFQGGDLGTPSAGVLTNATGLPVSTGIAGLGANVATALAIAVGSAGAVVTFNGALGTPSSGTATNLTGLPIAGITGLGAGVGTFLATPSSANLAAAVTDETGTAGSLVFSDGPTFTGTLAAAAITATDLTVTSGTITASEPIAITQTWNNGAVSFIGLHVNVTNTASGATADLVRMQVAGVTAFNVSAAGQVVAGVTRAQDLPTILQIYNSSDGSSASAIIRFVTGSGGDYVDMFAHGNLNYFQFSGGGGINDGRMGFDTVVMQNNAATQMSRLTTAGLRVGNTASAATSLLMVEGSLSTPFTTITTDTTLLSTHSTVISNRGATNTLTLPTASTCVGRIYNIQTIQAFTVVSASSNVVPKTGAAASTAILPGTDGAWCTLQSDGSNWRIIRSGT